MTLAARLYRTLGRIVPCDATVVLTLDVRHALTDRPTLSLSPSLPHSSLSPPRSAITFALLDGTAVREGVERGVAGFAAARPDAGVDEASRCAVALHANEPVAHAWFGRGRVPPAANTGGRRFSGIGLRLPPSCAYLFKVHVSPAWRGRGLGGALIAYGATALPEPLVDVVVTTTDFTNTPFRRTLERLGFEYRGRAAEIVFGEHHLYRLPDPLAVPGGTVAFSGGSSPARTPPERANRRPRGVGCGAGSEARRDADGDVDRGD